MERHSPRGGHTLHRQVGEDFMVLKKIGLRPLARRELGHPLGRLPPRGDHDVGVGDIGIDHRTALIEDLHGHVEQVEIRRVGLDSSGPAAAADQRAESCAERRRRREPRDDPDLMPALPQAIGIDGHGTVSAIKGRAGGHERKLHRCGPLEADGPGQHPALARRRCALSLAARPG